MGRLEDLEQHIRESAVLISEYESVLRLSSDPRERARSQRALDDLQKLLRGYLSEYASIAQQRQWIMPSDIEELLVQAKVESSGLISKSTSPVQFSEAPLNLEFRLRSLAPGNYAIDLHFDDLASAAPAELASGAPFALDAEVLRATALNPVLYGAQLSTMLFADRDVLKGWATAWGYTLRGDAPLRVRLHIVAEATELHALRWELLQHPQSDQFLATDERVVLSRYLDSGAMAPLRRRAAGELRALVLIANPANLADFQLAAVDVAGESSRARVALSALSPTIIASGQSGAPIGAGLIAERSRDGYDVIALVAHGGFRDGEPFVMLEDTDGRAAPIMASVLVDMLSQLSRRPTLVVLASCQSAGDESAAALTALGPQLLRAGVPAVLAMQGNISMNTIARMLPAFWRELQRDGQIDRTIAVARALARDLPDWWRPVLFSRLRDGMIWDKSL